MTEAKAGGTGRINRPRAGIILMIAATAIFALQDGVSRHLADNYNTFMVVMIRYWFFALFVLALAMRRPGGIARVAATPRLGLQITRGVLLAAEVCVMVQAFVILGLVESHAIFTCAPLIVAALSGPILGERVGWRRWTAIAVGCVGVLIILQPGSGVFRPAAAIPLLSATMFALYGLLTRFVAREDSAETSFVWTGVAGGGAMTLVGIWFWEPMSVADWGWMGVLCLLALLGHWLLIRCYDVSEAGTVQPFAYMQFVFVSILGVSLFGESLTTNLVGGAALVIAAGLFTLYRSARTAG